LSYAIGATSQSVDVSVYDDDGLPVTGLVAATFPTVKYSKAGANADATITLVDLALITTTWTSGGVKERGEGVYRLDVPNAAFSTEAKVKIRGEDTDKRVVSSLLIVGEIDAIADAVGLAFTGSSITVETNFNDESEELNLKRTDDYTSNTDQVITFTATGFETFPTDSVYFRASRNGTLLFAEVLCETAVLSATEQSVTLELTRDQVVLMNYGAVDDYRFRCTYVENTEIDPLLDNGEYRTVRWGKLNVERVGA
jgi:hypothetical protein